MGGAIAALAMLRAAKEQSAWTGLILNGPAFKVPIIYRYVYKHIIWHRLSSSCHIRSEAEPQNHHQPSRQDQLHGLQASRSTLTDIPKRMAVKANQRSASYRFGLDVRVGGR